jgi:hypothetical protein
MAYQSEEVRADPLMPFGPVLPGTYQWLDSDRSAARTEAREFPLRKIAERSSDT